ncbi:glycosyltransferase family 4 protein [Virgibacillus halodenitrificans]|uniref:glycosyltransferase family 4 protein n=1 Tax=Virgibacillus halodenitrificans TaxID=1482 RepID=UPI0024BFCF83|nr:glycosyltransferase family 4 protein [Virgibacillus halodenitrificans]WHX26179.1 glycosyltransferase family 4 protein [Virgibacillus halodenitrificans]
MDTIWILDHHASEPQHGGIIRHYDFALELANKGINVVVITSSYSHFSQKYLFQEQYKVVNIKENVHFIYLRTKPSYVGNSAKRFVNMASYVGLVKKYRNLIAKEVGEPNAVMGCSIHPLAWIAAYRCSKKFNAKFFIEVRDFWPDFFIKLGIFPKWHPVVIFFSLLEKWAYKRAEKIITSLPFAYRYISDELGFPKEKVVWIGQPMDCERFDNYAETKIELLPNDIVEYIESSFVCTFAGYYKEYEGVLTMLKAAKILKDRNIPIKFLFVGSGSERETMEEYVIENNLTNVYISSRINKEAIPSLLKKSEIKIAALSVSTDNAFYYGISKNKLNEYLYSGGCTIFGFTHKGSAVELSNGGFVVEPNNEEILAEKIIEVYQMSQEMYEELSVNGRSYIKNHHGVDILAEKLREVLLSN